MTEDPLSALRATSPEGGSKVCFYCLCERSEANSREGGGLRSIYFTTLAVGYFADAQYDVFFYFAKFDYSTAFAYFSVISANRRRSLISVDFFGET